jgi:ribosomal small subunit protein bTHX
MGKGDIKTRKGKLFNGSYGIKRPRKRESVCNNNVKECVYCGISMLSKKKSLQYERDNKRYPDNGETKDHVPQQCLFEGYPSDYKTNRFTVPSCHKCNLEFSLNEQELRDLIGVANENDDRQGQITKSAVKNIMSKNDGLERCVIIGGHVRAVEFDKDKLAPGHIKNFKGVFYKTFGKRFPDSFEIKVVDTRTKFNFWELALDFLDKNTEWKYSGHEDIFKYRIALLKSDMSNALVKAYNLHETILILCQLVYHKRFGILVLGHRPRVTKKKL